MGSKIMLNNYNNYRDVNVIVPNVFPTGKNLFEVRKKCYNLNMEEVSRLKKIKTIDKTTGPKITDALDRLEQQTNMLLFNWENDYYMAIAHLAALRSKDPRTPVS